MNAEHIGPLIATITRGVPAEIAVGRLRQVCWLLAYIGGADGLEYLARSAAVLARTDYQSDGPAVLGYSELRVTP